MSTIRTFGYDAVIQIDQRLASRMIAARTYDAARVPDGKSELDVIDLGEGSAPRLVEAGMASIEVRDGDNHVSLQVPLIGYSADLPFGRKVAVVIDDVPTGQTAFALTVDLSMVQAESIRLVEGAGARDAARGRRPGAARGAAARARGVGAAYPEGLCRAGRRGDHRHSA